MASRDRGAGWGAPGPSTQQRATDPTSASTPETARRRPEDPPTRDPSRYALTDHFRKRLAQEGRYVTSEDVDAVIRTGQLRWNTTDGWRFARVEDGVRLLVVVCDTETDSPVVVTAWTELADVDAALNAERWDRTDVETIRLRSALSERPEEHVPERIRPRDVPRPFRVCRHRLVTHPGDAAVRCLDCGSQFRSKTGLDRVRCSRR